MSALGNLFSDIAGAIREKTGETGTMKPAQFPEKIREIEGGGSADVRYVTFMSHDGTVEYGKKAVAVGDDCANPIARGVFETPTRESTVQHNYTFAGWATEANGGLNGNALKAVEEDRTVYANFIAAVRYYTVTYYDGETVLKTESVPYGSNPSGVTPAPTKDGYGFGGWDRAFEPVTGDTAYYAQWTLEITFANASWADIAAVSASGKAAEAFSLGDEKEFTFVAPDGKTYTTSAVIVGFNHDIDSNGNTVGISCVTKHLCGYVGYDADADAKDLDTTGATWDVCDLRNTLNSTTLHSFPDDLQAVIKPVKKKFCYRVGATETLARGETTGDKLWVPSVGELGVSSSNSHISPYTESDGPVYANSSFLERSTWKTPSGGSGYGRYALRTISAQSNTTFLLTWRFGISSLSTANGYANQMDLVLGFCI